MTAVRTGRTGPTVVFDVSAHGFGHLGQVAPIARALQQDHPACGFVVRTAHPAAVVHDFVGNLADFAPPPPEATMVMHGPTEVGAAASAEAHRRLCERWDEHVEREAARLGELSPSVLVSDVSYLSLAAAKRLGVPAIGLSSLNWADVYRAYCGEAPDAEAVLDIIEGAYRAADMFVQVQPHTPMVELANRRTIGPVARAGHNRKSQIVQSLGLPAEIKLVLVSLGGIPGGEMVSVPSIPNVHWLVGAGVSGPAGETSDVHTLALPYVDVLASSDAVVGKVGYATFVEAACNGTALISAPRPVWPETPYLVSWARENACFAQTSDGFGHEALRGAVDTVLAEPPKPACRPTGIAEACDIIAGACGLR